jgi:hypothetical protein
MRRSFVVNARIAPVQRVGAITIVLAVLVIRKQGATPASGFRPIPRPRRMAVNRWEFSRPFVKARKSYFSMIPTMGPMARLWGRIDNPLDDNADRLLEISPAFVTHPVNTPNHVLRS